VRKWESEKVRKTVLEKQVKYKKLTQRDVIENGDEYRTNWGTWGKIESEYVGKRKGAVFGWHLKMRRPILQGNRGKIGDKISGRNKGHYVGKDVKNEKSTH